MGKRETRVGSERTLRDVSIAHAVLCLIVVVLPLYYAVFTQSSGSAGILSSSPTPTGAMSAVTGAAVSGEPACPTFPAGAGIGGGCRLIGTTNVPVAVPIECIGGAGCTLRVVSNVDLASVYAGADVVSGPSKRTSEVAYNQHPTSNIVSLGNSYAIGSYNNPLIPGSYPGSSPSSGGSVYNYHNYYLTSEQAGASPYAGLYSSIGAIALQGGSASFDSVRFRSAQGYYYSFGMYPVELPCQLSIDSSIEADPTKFSVLTVPGAYPPASSCELYVCT